VCINLSYQHNRFNVFRRERFYDVFFKVTCFADEPKYTLIKIVLRKIKGFKTKFYFTCVQWMTAAYFYPVTNVIRALVLYVVYLCRLQIVNYFLCSLHTILLFITVPFFMNINMDLGACCLNIDNARWILENF
jgi:hypothetical protein